VQPFSFFLATLYIPSITEEAPRWVYFTMGVCIFVYMILDNSDGKQAVRTGSSSPLGELFDHGVDSCTIAMGTLMTASCFQAGPWDALYLAAPGFIAFYSAHWQEYFNHFLELGALNGPTEAECLAILLFIVTGFFGPSIWSSPVSFSGYTFVPFKVLVPIVALIAAFTAAASILDGLKLARKNKINTSAALSQLIPFSVSWISGAVWVFHSPHLFEEHPHIFLTMCNLLFAYLTISCIVQRMCDLPYQYFYTPMFGIMFGTFNSLNDFYTGAPIIREDYVLFGLWLYYFLTFLHFVNEIMTNFCSQLNINPWTIPYPNKGTKSS